MSNPSSLRHLLTAGSFLGIGLGGFVDGIVFHQLLQVHNMLSAKFPVRDVPAETLAINLEINMFWDGLFHAFCWTATVVGLGLLWNTLKRRDVPLSTQFFVGALILGWGLFNLVEGVIDHHLLHIHHVTETSNHLTWDLVFLCSGILFIACGGWLIRTAHLPPATVGVGEI